MLRNELGKDVDFKINPGLSSCSNNPSSASDYIDPLLKFAATNIPPSKHKETPLFILATAGMRLLPEQTQNAILDDLRKDIPKNYSFILSANHIQVISGKDEGIYSWIAINYLMGKFDHSFSNGPIALIDLGNKFTTRTRTIGMLEMGGASLQVAYEITSKNQMNKLKEKFVSDEMVKNMISDVNLGCSTHDSNHDYHLFVTTYLGLGANVARTNYVNSLISDYLEKIPTTSLNSKVINITDPCLSIDASENITSFNKSKSNNSSIDYIILKGTGEFQNCEFKLKKILNPKMEESKNCYSNVNLTCPLTKLRDTNTPFAESEFYGFSELWYTMNDVLGLGGDYSYQSFSKAASDYCSTNWLVLQDRFNRKLYPKADYNRLLYQCFKSAWITTILHEGFKMPKIYKKFRSALTVKGEQIQWTLGALLFRTRFFPLRAIEQLHIIHSTGNHTPYFMNYILFILCMASVVVCILIYLRHLHKLVNNYDASNGLQDKNCQFVSVEMDSLIESQTDL